MSGPSPIERMMGAVDFRCTRCGAKQGACDCWTKVTLRCPECKRTKQVTRDPSDPPGTAIVEAPCDRCDDGGGKPETFYFDAAGRQIDHEGKPFRVHYLKAPLT